MLSVSAFGSNHLQLIVEVKKAESEETFSIRIRIESSATSASCEKPKAFTSFQYPHSDRIICNPIVWLLVRIISILSVSAFGSNHLQRYKPTQAQQLLSLSVSAFGSNHLQQGFNACSTPRQSPFSIRIRIESSATSEPPQRHSRQHSFSIRIRIESSATRKPHRQSAQDERFQYPHSDRIICNCGLRLAPHY